MVYPPDKYCALLTGGAQTVARKRRDYNQGCRKNHPQGIEKGTHFFRAANFSRRKNNRSDAFSPVSLSDAFH
jgi:hypothetical protein